MTEHNKYNRKNPFVVNLDLSEIIKELKDYANQVIKEELEKLPPDEREKALKRLDEYLLKQEKENQEM
jgi:Mg/Co/Ni transporter MgtE